MTKRKGPREAESREAKAFFWLETIELQLCNDAGVYFLWMRKAFSSPTGRGYEILL